MNPLHNFLTRGLILQDLMVLYVKFRHVNSVGYMGLFMQMSFADMMVVGAGRTNARLQGVHDLVDWSRYETLLEGLANRSGMGPSGYPLLKLFKIMILQRLYDLSDPAMEEMLYDRLSFRHFCGFGVSEALPDETTLCRFRSLLGPHAQDLFCELLAQLKTKGFTAKTGVILDATVVASRAKRPQGGQVSQRDPEAGWTKKNGVYHHGYKMHTCVDKTHQLIQGVVLSSADVHDGLALGALVVPQDTACWADKAYYNQKNTSLLERLKIENNILVKASRGKPLKKEQKAHNSLHAKVRCHIERVFAHLKGTQGLERTRYLGIEKNTAWAFMTALAYNLKRAAKICQNTSLYG